MTFTIYIEFNFDLNCLRNAKLCKICNNKAAQASEFAAKMCTLYTLIPS